MPKTNNHAHAQALQARERADGLIRFRFNARVLAASAMAGAVALGIIIASPEEMQAIGGYPNGFSDYGEGRNCRI